MSSKEWSKIQGLVMGSMECAPETGGGPTVETGEPLTTGNGPTGKTGPTGEGVTGNTGRTPGDGPTLSPEVIARALAMREAFQNGDVETYDRLLVEAGLSR